MESVDSPSSRAERRTVVSQAREEVLQAFTPLNAQEDEKYSITKLLDGTCKTVLEHDEYIRWKADKSGTLLLLGGPGSGKSVLAKYLIEELAQSSTVCYFFFKEDAGQTTVQQALCAITHQLLRQMEVLFHYVVDESLTEESLWVILEYAARDPAAPPLAFVVDAMDECDLKEAKRFFNRLRALSNTVAKGKGLIKCFVTSRQTEEMMDLGKGHRELRITATSEDIRLVIENRLPEISSKMSPEIKQHLINQLASKAGQSFLWVDHSIKLLKAYWSCGRWWMDRGGRNIMTIDDVIAELPKGVNAAYEQMLRRTESGEEQEEKEASRGGVRRLLSIVLAAARPLTLAEFRAAVFSTSLKAITIEELEANIRCSISLFPDAPIFEVLSGFFLQFHQDRFHFLNPACRDFLLADGDLVATGVPQGFQWKGSFTMEEAHRLLAQRCVTYIDSFRLHPTKEPRTTAEKLEARYNSSDTVPGRYEPSKDFLDYAAKYWMFHYNNAAVDDTDVSFTTRVERICDPNSGPYAWWSEICSCDSHHRPLHHAAQFGFTAAIGKLLDMQGDVNEQDLSMRRTPLILAVLHRQTAAVELLLTRGADTSIVDATNATALYYAVDGNQADIVSMLIKHGADADSGGNTNYRPLLRAAYCGFESIFNLLKEAGADLKVQNTHGGTLLHEAARGGNTAMVKLLQGLGFDRRAQDNNGRVPLLDAASEDHLQVFEHLLYGANAESKTNLSDPALRQAAARGSVSVVEYLLSPVTASPANVDSPDATGKTALWLAAESGHLEVVRILLDTARVNIEVKDGDGQTALSRAVIEGHEAVVRLLLQHGADIETRRANGKTPLALAVQYRHDTIIELLQSKGASLETTRQL